GPRAVPGGRPGVRQAVSRRCLEALRRGRLPAGALVGGDRVDRAAAPTVFARALGRLSTDDVPGGRARVRAGAWTVDQRRVAQGLRSIGRARCFCTGRLPHGAFVPWGVCPLRGVCATWGVHALRSVCAPTRRVLATRRVCATRRAWAHGHERCAARGERERKRSRARGDALAWSWGLPGAVGGDRTAGQPDTAGCARGGGGQAHD